MQGETAPPSALKFAQVAVPVPARTARLFSYSVPHTFGVRPGNIVVVPLGSRVVPGLVFDVSAEAPAIAPRPLLSLVEGAPSVAPERLLVAAWMANYYHDSPLNAAGLFLPPGWRKAVVQSAEERSGWAFQWPGSAVTDDTYVVATGELPAGGLQGSGRWSRILSLLQSEGPLPAGLVQARTGCSLATLRSMVSRGMLSIVETDLGAGVEAPQGRPVPIALDPAQAMVFEKIAGATDARTHAVFVLHGVTGSGKTHVYLKLIEKVVRQGRRAIVLVSEIAQTPEALSRYERHFPGRVGLMHSGLRLNQRWELWRRAHEGALDVVVGPRSALFAPQPDLGLVVLDEEHEPAYKQDEFAPRYHARDTAIELARRYGATVVLGSATPDVATYHLAERGTYLLCELPRRYAGPTARGTSSGRLPRVQVVDLRDELRAGNTSILSRVLQSELSRVLAAGGQAILFLNRRGASTAVVCRDCGRPLKCRRCEVALVFHREQGAMVCHLCSRETPLPEMCPSCKGRRISYFGAGTERVQEEVRRLFPDARVVRWDHDVAGSEGAHAKIYALMENRQADVLVGTQMVAKALDFPLVTLVGVVLADVTLHLPDFRAAERTYQLLAQVAGRAGRGIAEGKVIIQTYSPGHYSIQAASRHDYRAFYQRELAFRRRYLYPPFRNLARLTLSQTGEATARYEALQMRKRLVQAVEEFGIPDVDIKGPAPAFYSKVRSHFRWQIVLAGQGLGRLIRAAPFPAGWSVDVDPVSLL